MSWRKSVSRRDDQQDPPHLFTHWNTFFPRLGRVIREFFRGSVGLFSGDGRSGWKIRMRYLGVFCVPGVVLLHSSDTITTRE
jgi:hypothetical protein